jgi:predicted ABC-type ATPase
MTLLAPNGKPSNLTKEQYFIVRTPEFKQWFGDWEKLELTKINDSGIDEISLKRLQEDVSKVVDENGEPLVVYHATTNDFNIFSNNEEMKRRGVSKEGIFFTNNLIAAETYIHKNPTPTPKQIKSGVFFKEKSNIMPVFLRTKKPLIVDAKFSNFNSIGEIPSYFEKDVKVNKNDLLLKSDEDFGVYYIIDKNNNNTVFKSFDKNDVLQKHDYFMTIPEINYSTKIINGSLKEGKHINDFILESKNNKKDSVIIVNIKDLGSSVDFLQEKIFGTTYVVFEPNQIKSAISNNGDFDLKNPDIRFEEGGEVNNFDVLNSEYYEKGGTTNSCESFDENGERKIDPVSIKNLTECILKLPQTKKMNIDNEGNYTKERQDLHIQIMNNFKKDLVCIDNDNPIAILMGGSPASGKSTFLKKYRPFLLNSELLKIDADEIRAKLPEYKGFNATQTQEETKDIVNTLLSDKTIGIPCDFDIVYDGTMNSVKSYLPLIELLKKRGYKIFVIYIDNVDYDVVLNRMLSRYQQSGRFVPVEVIDDFFSKGKQTLNIIKQEVDGYLIVDGSTNDYNILEKGGIELPDNRLYSKLGKPIKELNQFDQNSKQTTLTDTNNDDIRFEKGGRTIAQTPAVKSEQIYGSDVNKKGSSKDLKNATKIEFSDKTLVSIINKVNEHNKKHPNKKITVESAKAVVRRGMGAYSKSHRPTISNGKPNSRVAWGLARLNAFIYKIVNGKSKSGKYIQDDDLINELKMENKKFQTGGDVPNSNKMFHLPLELVVYVPSTKDVDKIISKQEMKERVDEVKNFLGKSFGGYSSVKVEGGYVANDGDLVNENITKVVSFASKEAYEKNKNELVAKMTHWSEKWGQEAIGFEFEGDLYYVPEKLAKGGKISHPTFHKLQEKMLMKKGGGFYEGWGFNDTVKILLKGTKSNITKTFKELSIIFPREDKDIIEEKTIEIFIDEKDLRKVKKIANYNNLTILYEVGGEIDYSEGWNNDYENDPIVKAQKKTKELAIRGAAAYATAGSSEVARAQGQAIQGMSSQMQTQPNQTGQPDQNQMLMQMAQSGAFGKMEQGGIIDYEKSRSKILVGLKTNLLKNMKERYKFIEDENNIYFFDENNNHFGTLFDKGTRFQELRNNGNLTEYGWLIDKTKMKQGGLINNPISYLKGGKDNQLSTQELKSLEVAFNRFADKEQKVILKRGGQTPTQKKKIEKVMHEFKQGKLHSGSKKGPIVTDREQAIAIALSEANVKKK